MINHSNEPSRTLNPSSLCTNLLIERTFPLKQAGTGSKVPYTDTANIVRPSCDTFSRMDLPDTLSPSWESTPFGIDRGRMPTHVQVHIVPHMSHILYSFYQMCIIRHFENSNVCTSPVRIGVAPGEALLVIGESRSVIPSIVTLAALRCVSAFATVLPTAALGAPPASQPDLSALNPSAAELQFLMRRCTWLATTAVKILHWR